MENQDEDERAPVLPPFPAESPSAVSPFASPSATEVDELLQTVEAYYAQHYARQPDSQNVSFKDARNSAGHLLNSVNPAGDRLRYPFVTEYPTCFGTGFVDSSKTRLRESAATVINAGIRNILWDYEGVVLKGGAPSRPPLDATPLSPALCEWGRRNMSLDFVRFAAALRQLSSAHLWGSMARYPQASEWPMFERPPPKEWEGAYRPTSSPALREGPHDALPLTGWVNQFVLVSGRSRAAVHEAQSVLDSLFPPIPLYVDRESQNRDGIPRMQQGIRAVGSVADFLRLTYVSLPAEDFMGRNKIVPPTLSMVLSSRALRPDKGSWQAKWLDHCKTFLVEGRSGFNLEAFMPLFLANASKGWPAQWIRVVPATPDVPVLATAQHKEPWYKFW